MKNSEYNCITCSLNEKVDELTSELIISYFCDLGSKGIYILEEDPLLKFSGYYFHEQNADLVVEKAKEYLQTLNLTAEYNIEKVQSEDWSTSFRQYFVPFHCSPKFMIVPSWEEDFTIPENTYVIKMDPSQAFGTGLHPTTQLCMEFIEDLDFQNKNVLEIGSGTGILSIGCTLRNASSIVATDNDPLCRESCEENFTKNGTLSNIEFRLGSLMDVIKPEEKFDYLIANILPDPVIQIISEASPHLKPDTKIIFSGIIQDEAPRVLKAAEDAGYELLSKKQKEEWVAFLFQAHE